MQPSKAQAKTTKAYQNLREVRKRIRLLQESVQKNPSEGEYRAYKRVTDEHVKNNPMLVQAIEQERNVAASFFGGTLSPIQREYLSEAYELIQKVPTFEGAPEGATENQFRAIEALVKVRGGAEFVLGAPDKQQITLLRSILLILEPHVVEKQIEAIEKAKEAKKQETETGALKILKMSPSNWHMQPVQQYDDLYPGKKVGTVTYMKLPDEAPITWGECMLWVDKGQVSWEKKPPNVFLHSEWHELWKSTGFASLHATDWKELSNDG